jgi:hypothetical protein
VRSITKGCKLDSNFYIVYCWDRHGNFHCGCGLASLLKHVNAGLFTQGAEIYKISGKNYGVIEHIRKMEAKKAHPSTDHSCELQSKIQA